MALLRDQPISCLTEWMAYDSKLSILSEQESTSIDAKSRLAQNEVETQLTSFLLRHSGLSELAARQLLNQIVVTEPLSRWHTLLTLSLFYVDLAALQNNSLHRDQSRYYENRAEAAREQLYEIGIGIASNPIPKANVPLVISAPGANAPRFLRARIRYVDFDQAVGALSSEFLLDMTSGESVQVSVDMLPARIAGWLLYLGETSESMLLATPSPIAAGTPVDITPSIPAISAPAMNKDAQSPDRFIRFNTEIWK
jgi:hypothetical protein